MKTYIVIVLTLLFSCNLFAQKDSITVSIPMQKWEELKLEKEHFTDSLSMLNDSIAHYKLFNRSYSLKIDSLRFNIDSLSVIVRKLQDKEQRFLKDSINYVNDSIKLHKQYQLKNDELNEKLKIAKSKSARADTIAIQMMITYLNLKCSGQRIMELRQNFANIPNDTLRSEYGEIDDILSLYSETYQKVIELARTELKSGKIASAESALFQDMYVNEYKQQLDDLKYVRIYYNNEEYTSPYLNEMLKISYEALESKNLELLKNVIKM